MIKVVPQPVANSRRKAPARIVDIETNEELVSADLTLAMVKKFIKYYATFGIYTKATHDGIEVA